jgi:type I restriction enzyme, S subunit
VNKYKHIPIGEICSIIKGLTGIAKAIPGQYPLVTTGPNRKTCNTYQFDTDAVCIPIVSSSGHGKKSLNYVHFQSGRFALGTILAAVIPKNPQQLLAAFLHRYLEYYKDQKIVPLMKGAANVTLALKDLSKIEIPVPPIEEQVSFVNRFNRLNSLINELQQENQSQVLYLSLLRQTFLRELIEGGISPDIKGGEYMQEYNLTPIKQEEIPIENCDNILWCRLGEICEVIKGNIGITKSIPGEYPLIALSKERLFHNEYQFNCKGVIIPLISSSGHGHASMNRIHYQEGKFSVGNILCCVYPKYDGILNMRFVFNYLDMFKELLFVRKMKGAANVSLSISSIAETPIPLVPINIQNKYEVFVNICDKMETQINHRKIMEQKLRLTILREEFQIDSERTISH